MAPEVTPEMAPEMVKIPFWMAPSIQISKNGKV
jgi:hypothetical protein